VGVGGINTGQLGGGEAEGASRRAKQQGVVALHLLARLRLQDLHPLHRGECARRKGGGGADHVRRNTDRRPTGRGNGLGGPQ